MELNININEVHEELFHSRKRYQLSIGGSGSGKSQMFGLKLLLRILTEKKLRAIVLRKYAVNIKDSVYYLLNRLILENNLEDLFTINVSPPSITCVNGNKIIFKGLDKVDKLKSIEDIKLCWIEEADQITLNDFLELDRRLRGQELVNNEYVDKNIEIWFSLNPVDVNLWINKIFFESETSKYKAKMDYCFSTFKDNAFIDENYRETLEALKDIDYNQYRIYALGEWGVMLESVYPAFLQAEFPDHYEQRFFGLDFGFTNSKTAIVEIRQAHGIYYVKELCYKSGMTNGDIAEFLRAYGVKSHEVIYCDSAEPKSIEDLYRMKLNVKPAVKDVKAGISFVKANYKNIRFDFDSVNLIRENKSYKYVRDKNGNILDEVVKESDHLLDALRYALYTNARSYSGSLSLSFG